MWPTVTALWLVLTPMGWGAEDPEALSASMLVHYEAGRFREAEIDALKALVLLRDQLEDGDPALAAAVSNAAMMHRARGRFAEALPLLIEAVERATESQERATYLENLAGLYQERGEFDNALQGFQAALELREKGAETSLVARTLNSLAVVQQRLDRDDEAYASYTRSLALYTDMQGTDDRDLGVAFGNLARLVEERGDPIAASKLHRHSVDLLSRSVGADHPDIAVEMSHLAQALWDQGDRAGARDFADRALRILDAAFPDGHPRLAAMLARSAIFTEPVDREAAAELYRRSLKIRDTALGPDHPITARSQLGLGSMLADPRDALPLMEQAASVLLVSRGPDHPDVAAALEKLGVLSIDLEQFASAEDYLNQAIEIRKAQEDPLAHARALTHLATLRLAEDRKKDARARYAEAFELAPDDRGVRDGYLAVFDRPDEARVMWERVAGGDCDAVSRVPGVSFVRYQNAKEAHYAGFVVGEACDVRRVELGPAAQIDDLVRAHRDGFSDAAGRALAEQIWTPLELEAADLWIEPRGALAAVSFAALPIDGKYLIERSRLSYGPFAAEEPVTGSGVLVVGAVDHGTGEDARGCSPRDFAPIGDAELHVVVDGWGRKKIEDDGAALVISGMDASEEAVSAALPGKRLVHLSTHGYFASERCGGDLDPRVLAGIVVAGANLDRPPLELEDGIVDAVEIADVDLTGTELVMLSHTDLGLDVVRTGEALVTLRTAFAHAGAQSFVATLWAVPEAERLALLERFYTDYLRKRKSPAEALRRAQIKILKRNRRQLGDARPEHWAAFIASSGPSST